MVNMSEVAKVARVSQSTVSHVINKTRKVRPETERAVLEAIQATGYAGDHIARSLRKGATGVIGLAMSAISNPYFGDIVHAIEEKASKAGYSILLAETHSDPVMERKAVGHLAAYKVDAVVLAASADPSSALLTLQANGIPAVLVDRVPASLSASLDAVGVVNLEPTAWLVDHLVAHGHRRIAMLTGRRDLATTEERIAGFQQGVRRNGLDPEQTFIRSAYDDAGQPSVHAVIDLLKQDQPPTALVLGNNQTTITTMAALRELRWEVPRDIAIVAFDDFPWSDLFHPRLTVVAQPVEQIGAAAVTMLLERLADGALPPREMRIEPVVRIRESCGCPA